MENTGTYVRIMQESLARKQGYLTEILAVTQRQTELAAAEEFDEDAFSGTVEQKEVLINNINEIDKGFSSVYERVRLEIQDNPSAYRTELLDIQERIKACVDTGMEIEATEERNRAALEQAFAIRFKGLRQVKQSKSVANRYYKSMANGMVNDSLLYDKKK